MSADKLGSLSDYVLLGKSGLRVSPLCLGCMTFGEEWGFGSNEEESLKVFNAYYNLGGNFFDTANVYTNGSSESLLGKFIAQRRSNVVVATKYSGNWGAMSNPKPDSPNGLFANTGGNSRKSLVESLDVSLKRLGINYIDLFYVHVWEYRTPITEVMRALDDVVRSGKVLYLGISDAPSWVTATANTMADLRGWSRFIAYQTRYNLIERSFEAEIRDVCETFGVGGVPWGCLAEGFLTGKYDKANIQESLKTEGKRATGRTAEHVKSDANWAVVDKVKEIAAQINKTPAQVTLNWLLQKPGIVSPLVGARTEKQIVDNAESLSFKLTKEQIQALDDVQPPKQPFPYNFFDGDSYRSGTSDRFVTAGSNIKRAVGSPFLV